MEDALHDCARYMVAAAPTPNGVKDIAREPQDVHEFAIPHFDYSNLNPTVAKLAREEAPEIRRCQDTQLQAVVEAGQRLARVKTALPHGDFGPWLNAEFAWTSRTAERFIKAAEYFGGSKTTSLSHLPLTLLYRLSSRSAEPVRTALFQQIDRGDHPNAQEIEQKLDDTRRQRGDAAGKGSVHAPGSSRHTEPTPTATPEADNEATAANLLERHLSPGILEELSSLLTASDFDFRHFADEIGKHTGYKRAAGFDPPGYS